jgi:hypothetical protein
MIGCWRLDAGDWMLDTGCWILDAGYWILDTGDWKPYNNFKFFSFGYSHWLVSEKRFNS